MKDEIKEFIEFRTDEDGTYFYYNDKDNIEQWSYKLDELKDYITNLQEENEILRKNAEHNDKIVDKSRNKKAIKYIKEHIVEPTYNDEQVNMNYTMRKILDILKGE